MSNIVDILVFFSRKRLLSQICLIWAVSKSLFMKDMFLILEYFFLQEENLSRLQEHICKNLVRLLWLKFEISVENSSKRDFLKLSLENILWSLYFFFITGVTIFWESSTIPVSLTHAFRKFKRLFVIIKVCARRVHLIFTYKFFDERFQLRRLAKGLLGRSSYLCTKISHKDSIFINLSECINLTFTSKLPNIY